MKKNLNGEEFLLKVRKATLEKLSNPKFGVSELAQKTGYSREYITRRLQELEDKSASFYIMEQRLQHSAQLLCSQPKLGITRVAMASGFDSHAYFSKCFKAYYGMTPSAWRSGCSSNGR